MRPLWVLVGFILPVVGMFYATKRGRSLVWGWAVGFVAALLCVVAASAFGQTTYTPLGPPAGLAQPVTRWDSQGEAQPCTAIDLGGLGVTVVCPGDPQPDLGVPPSIQDEGDAGDADE